MFKTHFRTGCSKCPQPWNSRFQTDDVLGDSQLLALVYFHQIVIFQWRQWFALSDWSNSTPLTTWGFLVYFRLLQTLWCQWLPCSVGEKFKYLANEDTGMPHFISKSDIPPLFGSNRSSLTLSGWISFSLRLIFCGFLFWAFLDSELFNPSGIQFTLSSYFSYNSYINANLFVRLLILIKPRLMVPIGNFPKWAIFFC